MPYHFEVLETYKKKKLLTSLMLKAGALLNKGQATEMK